MLLPRKYYPLAKEKAEKMCCPDCWGNGTMEYAAEDDDVLVCEACGYSVEDSDLEDDWIEALLNEYGVDSLDDDE